VIAYGPGKKNMHKIPLSLVCLITLLAGSATSLKAAIIDFEAQGASAPSAFNSTLNSPLVIGIAAFTGGQLLNHESGGIDQTAVYATTSFTGSGGYTDPLTITFSQPINLFSIDVTNATPDTFTVADNLSGSQSFSLPGSSTHNFSLTDSGITSVTIRSASTTAWDFAIDNVQFTQVTSGVPEPSAMLLLASSLGIMGMLARRKSL
jgi:hypothetical protein